jgi:hypothetical protein
MNQLLDMKFFNCVSPQSANGGSFANNTAVDTQGLLDLIFLIETGAMAAAIGSVAATNALEVEECDAVGGSYTDVTDAALAAAIADTKDNKMYAIRVNLCKSHKRFMRIKDPVAGAGACLLSVKAIGVPNIAPQIAAGMGLEELVLA